MYFWRRSIKKILLNKKRSKVSVNNTNIIPLELKRDVSLLHEEIMPETLDALERYLANGSVKGIGPATAKKIIDTFGDNTIYVFFNSFSFLNATQFYPTK